MGPDQGIEIGAIVVCRDNGCASAAGKDIVPNEAATYEGRAGARCREYSGNAVKVGESAPCTAGRAGSPKGEQCKDACAIATKGTDVDA